MKSMKRLIPGLIIVVGVLTVAGVVASNARTSQANEATDIRIATHQTEGQVADGEEHSGVAFIGVALAPLSDAEAADAGLEDGALVASVVEGSPADGLLMQGDIVTAVDGKVVTSPIDVVEIVHGSQAGDLLVFTVSRNGESLDIDVTSGGRQVAASAFRDYTGLNFMPHYPPQFGDMSGLIKSEVKQETEDGVRTIRTAVGTVSDIDVEAGSFSLTLKDGSEIIEYQIDDETIVTIHHVGDLASLNTDDLTTVVDMTVGGGEWKVKSVSQGEHSGIKSGHSFMRGHGLPGGFGMGFQGPQFHMFQRDLRMLPGHGDEFPDFLSPEAMDEMLENLPDDVRERIEKFHLDSGHSEVEKEIIIEGSQS
ncbi:MAG: PDZ domain-containing protein [Chloroflexi bacterium]|nr:PDZ domain-containing protein [Chloroflexota bacterium]MDA1228366.1 PDZ domain-containing protein [Chloroflexota bacterium]